MAEFQTNIKFAFQIIDENDDEVLWNEWSYILVDAETFKIHVDSAENHIYSAFRHLPEVLRRKAQEAEDARREQEELDAEDAAEAAALNPVVDPVREAAITFVRDRINQILKD